MHRVDTATAVTSLPAVQAAGTPGFFVKGDPTVPTAATSPGPDWFNMIQEELYNVVVQAGLTPDATKADFTQVYDAIIALRNAGTLANHSDVTLTTPTNGQALIYDGANWVNGTPASAVSQIEKTLLMNGLLDTVAEGAAARLINSFPDPYAALTGINTGSASGYSHNVSGAFLTNEGNAETQIPQGTGTNIGDFTAWGGLTKAYDGTTSAAAGNECAGTANVTVARIGKDLGAGNEQAITGFKSWGANNNGHTASNGNCSIALKASNTDPTTNSWSGDTIATIASFANTNSTQLQSSLGNSNTTKYRYVWEEKSTTDSAQSFWSAEVQFFQTAPTTNLIVPSNAILPLAVPTDAHFIGFVEPVDAITYGTDLTVSMTRDNGSTWDPLSLSQVGETTISVNGTPTDVDVIYGEASLTGASQQNGLYKWESFNTKQLRLHGAAPEFS